MLKAEDNERLVRVGPGTPGGELFRRYWIPALLSSEMPEADEPQQRLRLLGEDLLAFRDSEGVVGIVDAYCPHRRAPLFVGRNEECGIRCAYHGWKFDRTGRCLEIPNEPADSPMKTRMRILAYPTVETGGIVWTYMGPADQMPPPPDYEWLRAPATHRFVSKTYEACNYLQALEGGLDTSHSSFVHNNNMNDPTRLRSRDRSPRIDVQITDYGYYYTSERKIGDDRVYLRVYRYIMPSQQMRSNSTNEVGARHAVPKLDGHIWVPIDDENTMVYNWMCGYDEDAPLSPEVIEANESFTGRGKDDFIPGTFRLKRNLANDYLVDRQLQRERTFTGITGLNTQDFALQEGMGRIVDRSKEHLGTADRPIITMRRLMLEAIDAVERGLNPKGRDPDTTRHIRPYDGILEAGADWKEAFAEKLEARW